MKLEVEEEVCACVCVSAQVHCRSQTLPSMEIVTLEKQLLWCVGFSVPPAVTLHYCSNASSKFYLQVKNLLSISECARL